MGSRRWRKDARATMLDVSKRCKPSSPLPRLEPATLTEIEGVEEMSVTPLLCAIRIQLQHLGQTSPRPPWHLCRVWQFGSMGCKPSCHLFPPSSPHQLPSATVINPTKLWSRRNVNHETPRFKTISKRATENQSAYLKQSQSHDVCSASHAPRPLSCHRPVTHRCSCHLSQKFGEP